MRLRRLLPALLALVAAAPAQAATQELRFTASDRVSLQATLRGADPLGPRPVIVEFSPYGRNSGTLDAGPSYNHLLVQIRGTGDSDGRFDALGPRTQADVAEVLRWACDQPWSDGRLGINGFSASAITIYNSLHRELPCVRGAVLKSGTFELYRDLIWPGGVSNLVPAAGVMALIGAPALAQSFDRLARDPASGADVLAGLVESGLSGLLHPTLDGWWRERGFRGDVNDLPILMVNGFFDVESRGAFQAYQELRDDGARLLVVGAHDGAPAGTDAGVGEMRAWMDRHVRGIENGIEDEPRVKLWLADGDREDQLAGRFVRRDATDWPVPGTRWQSLALTPGRGLSAQAPLLPTRLPYASLPSLPSSTDPYNTAIAGGFGVNQVAAALPFVTEMGLAQGLGLSFTTPPLGQDLVAAGPASVELRLASTAPETAIWVVLSDVWPDGSAHPVAAGRLSTAYPHVDGARSLPDPATGAIVQPYNRFDAKAPAPPLAERRYHVEVWPIGNRFRAGHRVRLHVIGASATSVSVPAVNTVTVGGPSPSRLLLPVLPAAG